MDLAVQGTGWLPSAACSRQPRRSGARVVLAMLLQRPPEGPRGGGVARFQILLLKTNLETRAFGLATSGRLFSSGPKACFDPEGCLLLSLAAGGAAGRASGALRRTRLRSVGDTQDRHTSVFS